MQLIFFKTEGKEKALFIIYQYRNAKIILPIEPLFPIIKIAIIHI